MKTSDARSLPAAAQEDPQRRTVKAVLESLTHARAAEVFGVGRPTVTRWVSEYRDSGARALRAKSRGRPPGTRLAPHQAAIIVRLIVGAVLTNSDSPPPSGPKA